MERMYLSDTINYAEDIEKHRFIQIYSGVGSGKNTFIEKMITGDPTAKPPIPRRDVLIITSRRSKVDETLCDGSLPVEDKIRKNAHFFGVDDFEEKFGRRTKTLFDCRDNSKWWGEVRVHQNSVVCTNAFIEAYLKYVYDPLDITTFLWERFDAIIIDEVHSVVLDASYQSAPFYVKLLVNKILRLNCVADEKEARGEKDVKRPQCQQIILMTGTPDSIEDLGVPGNAYVIDRFEECINVMPHEIHFIESEDAKKQIAEQLRNGEKVVYFSNHRELTPKSTFGVDLSESQIAVSFSGDQKRSELKRMDRVLFDNMERTEESIRETGMLPSDVQFFVSTSRNSEGINIKNRDIHHLYVESHNYSTVKQMAGRIRSGVAHMYVIIDSRGYATLESKHEEEFSRRMIAGYADKKEDVVGSANVYLKELCEECGIKELYCRGLNAHYTIHDKECTEIMEYVDYIHGKFPYAKYDYFRNVFQYDNLRKIGLKYQMDQERQFAEAKKISGGCQKLLQEWFPDSIVHPYYSVKEQAVMAIEEVRENASYGNGYFSLEEKEALEKKLNEIFRKELSGDSLALGRLLTRAGNYKMKQRSHEKTNPYYNHFCIEKIEEEPLAS